MSLSLEHILRSVDERPTLAAYARAAREVRSFGARLRPVRVSLLSTFTIDSLAPYLEVEAARRGLAADIYLGPFGAVGQELLDPGSGCLSHRPDVVFVAQLLCDVCPPLANDFLALSEAQAEQHVAEIVSDAAATLKAFR